MDQGAMPLAKVEVAADPAAEVEALRPALFARFGVLEDLRYDFPLVLVEGEAPVLRPLTGIMDDILRRTAPPGMAGEALRQHVLRLEGTIRRRVAKGERGSLTNLWRASAADLLAASGQSPFGPLDADLDRAREALNVDGQVIDCDADAPHAVLVHAWKAVYAGKGKEFRKKVDGLILRLSDILKAEFMKSDAARTAQALESSVGSSFGSAFDFDALSRVLSHGTAQNPGPDLRQERIRRIMQVLKSQRFFPPGRSSEHKPDQPGAHNFIFESCAEALDAFRQRLGEIVDFVKAVTIAELEIANKYHAAQHDPIFETFDESDLSAEQLALLPSSLVCLRDGTTDTADTVRAFEALASGLPIKVLIQTDDIIGDTSPEPSRTAFGVGSAHFAAMAMGLNNAYVLQATSAHLCRVRDRLIAGMRHDGPALFSVFSGAVKTAPHVSAYLMAAAATEARAFPTFSYDPSAGPDWATRFDLNDNPQREADWPAHWLDYEDEAVQRQGEDITFTYADFVASDRRYVRYRRPVAKAEWHVDMMPAAECLKRPDLSAEAYVLTVGADNAVRRTVIDDKLIEAARRCNDAWRRLQELAGINNSHASRLLAREKTAWEAQRATAAPEPNAAEVVQPAASPAPTRPAVPAGAAVQTEAPEPVEEAEPVGHGDDPFIETGRCTTCNECTQINSHIFAYNENMQAFIADPDAGTYRELVEAAESCQVSIIHPGKPRNLDEPNLAELMSRAESFN